MKEVRVSRVLSTHERNEEDTVLVETPEGEKLGDLLVDEKIILKCRDGPDLSDSDRSVEVLLYYSS
jgi:hypothetical protein